MNHVSLIGRIASDLELKKTSNGHSVVNFSLAVSRTKDKEKTDFFNCVVWNKGAEAVHLYANKGDLLGISGELHTRSYVNKYDVKTSITEITVSEVTFLTKRSSNETLPLSEIPIENIDIADDQMQF